MFVNLVPKRLAQLFLRIHQRGGQLLEDIILREHVAAELGFAQFIRNNAVFLIRRKVDPQVVFGDGHGGQKIFDQPLGFVFDLILRKISVAAINNEVELQRVVGVNGHAL